MQTRIVNDKIKVFDIANGTEYNKVMRLYDRLDKIIEPITPRALLCMIDDIPEDIRETMREALKLRALIMDSLMDYNYNNSDNDKSTDWRKIRLDRVV